MGRKVHPIGFRLNINQPWLGAGMLKAQNIPTSCTRTSRSAS